PIDFRLKNAAQEGTRRVDGPVYPRIGLVETLEAAKGSAHWKSSPMVPIGPALEKTQHQPERSSDRDGRPTLRGRGIASGFWFNIGGVSSCSANVNDDGTVTLLEG